MSRRHRPIQAPNPVAFAAINYACGQRGLPYVWGGNGPADGGFDCLGLTKAAYVAAGITLPRTADAQFRAGPRVSSGQPLLPGDLVFYGNAAFNDSGRHDRTQAPGSGRLRRLTFTPPEPSLTNRAHRLHG